MSRLSHALNAVLVAALMWGGAVSFKKVLKSEDNQLAYTMQVILMHLQPGDRGRSPERIHTIEMQEKSERT